VTPWKRNGVKVSGSVEADITQACIVTLEPVAAHIDEAVEALFLPEQSKLGRQGFEGGGEILLDAEGPDSPETFSGDTIDVGALAEQLFGLAIDPYPRKPGASLEAAGPDDASENEFQQKLRFLAGKILKPDPIGEKPVVRQPKPLFSPNLREPRISRARCPGPS